MIKRVLIFGAIFTATVVSLPFWGDYVNSAVLYVVTEKPAHCFSTIRTVINDRWMPPACAEWRHCAANDDENLAKGYTCIRRF
jgi:hypothetical protein